MESLILETQSIPARPNWKKVVRDALRGKSVHPTEGPLAPAIIALAIPMVLEMVMESLFAVVDIFFVSRLGSAAVAAVGLTESLLSMIYTVAAGLSIGVMAVVSRRMGERDPDAAGVAAVQAILLGLTLSVIMGVTLSWNAPRLLQLMGAEEEVIRVGSTFSRVMLGGSGVILMLFLINAAFRGAADAVVAMRVLWFANAINIVLCPLLIYGVGPFPELGVTGSAVATTTGRGLGVLLQITILMRGSGHLQVRWRHVRLQLEVMARVIRLSATGMLQVFIATASWMGLIRVLSGFGSEALAGYTMAIRIVLFALLPAWGLANAAATMVGQSLGAKNPERAEQAVWMAGRMNLMFLGSVGLIFVIGAPVIVAFFGGDALTQSYAVQCLRIVSAGFLFYAYGMVINNSFNGAGDTWTPTLLNLVCFWLIEIPLAWILSHRVGIGPSGVFLSITIAFSTLALLSAWLFRRGHWKRIKV